MNLQIVILAAGQGKRTRASRPKVLQPLGGQTLLERVVQTASALQPAAIHVIYGNGGALVKNQLSHLGVNWVYQQEQLGTGHAVLQAMPYCAPSDRVLVLYGDVPLIGIETLRHLLQATAANQLGLLVATLTDPAGLGRILRDAKGQICAIVEEKDADDDMRAICEINTGILVCPADFLQKFLPNLSKQNKQGEYYLTDIISLATQQGLQIQAVSAACVEEIKGVNDLWQLAELERHFQRTQAQRLTEQGVVVRDPARLDICGDVKVGPDTVIGINVILEGDVIIGKGCLIGANVVIRNATLGDHVQVLENSIIEGAVIHEHCQVGPFARLRPGTVLHSRVRVGNFVEIKNSEIGAHSKANHLSYLGDAVLGQHVNIGAGTITCNYDGAHKHKTTIEDHAFIGSNVCLVAPVTVGFEATIGAGSVITRAAPPKELTVARGLQKTISGWKRPQKETV